MVTVYASTYVVADTVSVFARLFADRYTMIRCVRFIAWVTFACIWITAVPIHATFFADRLTNVPLSF